MALHLVSEQAVAWHRHGMRTQNFSDSGGSINNIA